MKHFRIIETGPYYPDVLAHRDRDDHGEEIVRLLAVGIKDGEKNMFAEETVVFADEMLACCFISDLSVDSARDWCDKQGVSHW